MAGDVLAEFVVRQARAMIQPESDVELIDVKSGIAHVRYRKGYNPKCIDCILSPEDLKTFLLEMFAKKASHITDVSIEVEEDSSRGSQGT